MRQITKTDSGGYYLGELPKGCQQCMIGAKLVVFVSGLCNERCYYCPVSTARLRKDRVFANEVETRRIDKIIQEGRLIDAEGASITGGEPLLSFQRTTKIIRLLKNAFGQEFHIHLYTSGIGLTTRRIQALSNAGLDELRIHPLHWQLPVTINKAINSIKDVGCEIPAIPGTIGKIQTLASQLNEYGASFLNLNEFEFSETNVLSLKRRGFKIKKGSLAAVAGSERTAIAALEWIKDHASISAYYCPSNFKDRVQLRNRFIRRAKNVAEPFAEITTEGLIRKGVIIMPIHVKTLHSIRKHIIRDYHIANQEIMVDKRNNRLVCSPKVAQQLVDQDWKGRIGIIEEHPTHPRIQISYTPLNKV